MPEFELHHFEAKIDTGAYTSAIHCSQIQLIDQGRRPAITFHILPPNNQEVEGKVFQTRNFKLKNIRNSFGQTEERFVIRTRIRMGKKIILAEFSLSDRTEMRYPILIGRKLLQNRFLVDVSLCHTFQL